MSKYSLTLKQQEILRVAAEGIRKGEVGTTWLYAPAMGDRFVYLTDFDASSHLEIKENDLKIFEIHGFIFSERRSNCTAFHVSEQLLYDAVDNDFEIPKSDNSTSSVQNIHINSINNSNLNIGIRLEHIQQSVGTLSNLNEGDKTELSQKIQELSDELEKLEETNPTEAKAMAKQLDRVVEDLGDDDQDGVAASIERLNRAASNLLSIAPKVFGLAIGVIEFIKRIRGIS